MRKTNHDDLTGRQFGKLRIQGPAGDTALWIAVCLCGGTRRAYASLLLGGRLKSCGCGEKRRDQVRGQRFGMLTAIADDGNRGPNVYWRVRCDCGVEKSVQRGQLFAGRQTSCGCNRAKRKHGMEGSKVYNVWASMKARCQNPNHRRYGDYGARGIKVCERWQKFENFYADMGEPTGVLDRIDNNGNYEPGNCRWTTWSVSNKNKRPRKREELN